MFPRSCRILEKINSEVNMGKFIIFWHKNSIFCGNNEAYQNLYWNKPWSNFLLHGFQKGFMLIYVTIFHMARIVWIIRAYPLTNSGHRKNGNIYQHETFLYNIRDNSSRVLYRYMLPFCLWPELFWLYAHIF